MAKENEKLFNVTGITQDRIISENGRVVDGLRVTFTIPELSETYSITVPESTPAKIKDAIMEKRNVLLGIMEL